MKPGHCMYRCRKGAAWAAIGAMYRHVHEAGAHGRVIGGHLWGGLMGASWALHECSLGGALFSEWQKP